MQSKQVENNSQAMIKKSIFTLILMAFIGYVSAQSLQFEWNGNAFNDGDAVECTNDEYGYGEYIEHMQIRNLGSEELNILVEKEVLETLEGTMNFFCWGSCFGPDVMVSPRPVTLAGNSVTGEQDLSFHAMFDEGVFGYVVVKYYAYDERTPDERVSIIVKFHKSGAGIENVRPMEMGKAFPNPASSMVHFNYSFDGNLTAVVYNLLGQEVIRQDLDANSGQMNISVADLQDGIYFCTMMVNGRAMGTQKFVVKK